MRRPLGAGAFSDLCIMEKSIEEYKRKHRLWNILSFAGVEAFWGVGIGLTSQSVVIPIFLAKLGASKMLIGCLPLLWGIFPCIPQVLVGYFTEHMGRKKVAVTLGHFAPVLVSLFFGLFLLYFGQSSAATTLLVFFICYALYSIFFGSLFRWIRR
jgi:hypothetical protein